MMKITDIRIRKLFVEGKLRALISITIDYDLAVHDIKIIAGSERLFVAMPSYKNGEGVFRDIIHPITAEAREMLEKQVISAYEEYLNQLYELI